MTDVIPFPERRPSIPVNLPNIGCIQSAQCPDCGRREWTVMILSPNPVPTEYRCAHCGTVVDLTVDASPA